MFEELPKDANSARLEKSKWYFTNKPCKRGHIDKRMTSTRSCYKCIKEQHKSKESYKKIRNEYSKKYSKKRRENPYYRLNDSMRNGIYSVLKEIKNSTHWEEFVEFSREELISHLEKQFRDGMTWENYGPYWHIDHIKPITLCSSFEEAWELSNLQPLTAEENRSKGNRYIG